MIELISAETQIKRFPHCVYVMAVGFWVVLGLADSIYLAISHYRVHTDIGYQSFCALSRAVNCDTVAQSPESVLINLPVAVWGATGYSFFLALVLFYVVPSRQSRPAWTLCLALAMLFSMASIVFAGISFSIGTYCILCILSYFINLMLVYSCWIIRRRFVVERFCTSLALDLRSFWQKRKVATSLVTVFSAGLIMLNIVYPQYWKTKAPFPSPWIQTGLTAEGHPWIGAEHPVLEVHEFTDYLCFQCRKMHYSMRDLVSRYPEKIRLVHLNFPLDHEFNPLVKEPFHVGSGKMALLAIHAAGSGNFWNMNDRLYAAAEKAQNVNLLEVANDTGVDARSLDESLKHETYRQRLAIDIHHGIKMGITGTPSYLVNGKVYQGRIPADVFTPVFAGGSR